MTIQDHPFQIFCFGRYLEPVGGLLTQYQEQVYREIKRFNGDMLQAATSLGLSPANVYAHVQHIRDKGWPV